MGLKKTRPLEVKKEDQPVPKVETVEKSPKKEKVEKVVKVKKEKKEKIVEPVVVVPVVTVEPEGKKKREWDGLGLNGTGEAIRMFRGKIKMQGKVFGEILLGLIKEWNAKN